MDASMENLVRQAKAGDREAFTSLVLQNEAVLSRVAMSVLQNPEDAADAVQETVFAAWRHLGKLHQTRYFRTWIVRILLRKCYGILEQRNKHSHTALEDAMDGLWEPDRDTALDVHTALGALGREDHLLLALYYRDGLSLKEIAKAFGISHSAAKQRLCRSREKFRAVYVNQERGDIYEP